MGLVVLSSEEGMEEEVEEEEEEGCCCLSLLSMSDEADDSGVSVGFDLCDEDERRPSTGG